MRLIGGIMVITLLMIVALPMMMVLFFGMLPTLVVYFIDRSEEKYHTFSVGGMNFAGVFPYLLDLWKAGDPFNAAQQILTNVFSLTVMLGAAGFGWIMFLSVPPVIVAFLTVIAQRRIVLLRSQQVELIKEWGKKVAGGDEG
ncbi:MAG: hypothetical protein A3G18_05130 [Rhodospirillales bacterium RIFCSPLOWO2_12_FULL_58_28]|nr:MAG: hypothetical protein A3H92_05225 [Rhodospirillales bacterium RIFCSPLOWO2_02_FULL_58_16]OHC78293.1 MAG: hypothetical protein A3G18_05130 [Rhodospirillales bacterium RIFCSPLOWO2_12_FULL_58_28]